MPTSILNLYNLALHVHLGVPDWERQTPQIVLVDLSIRFDTLPQGCTTDRIEDTLCYAGLCAELDTLVQGRSFHLIESLAYLLYHEVKKRLRPEDALSLKLRKNPPLENLEVSEFCIGEWK